MNIAIIGASGFTGSVLLREALARDHKVTALVAHPEKLAAQAGLRIQGIDALDEAVLTESLRGLDAVISAFSGHAQTDVYDYYMRGIRAIIAAAKQARTRLLVVGGAASLEIAPGLQLIDTPDFPEAYKHGTAGGARDALNLLRQETALDWTMLSPSLDLAPGQRTGRFRLGGDQLLVDANGASAISLEDYAVAMIDELERPAHSRRRFTVGY